MKFGKKLLSVLLTVMMIVSMINVTAFAEPDEKVAKINTTEYSTLADAVADAKSGETVEITVAGTYPIPNPIDGVTIDGTKAGGADSVIFDASKQTGQLAGTSGKITFKNVTFQFGSANYTGFQHPGNITFEECKLNGFITTYGDMTFEKCTLTSGSNQYAINFYGGSTFNLINCHFYGVDKNVYIYQETLDGDKNVTFTNCDFHMSGSGDTKSAIMLNAPVSWADHVYNVAINNCTAEGGMNKTAAADVAGNINYQGIYGLKHIGGSGAASLINGTVTINGVQVYPEPVAQIGKINYSTLADAVADAKSGDTITLLKTTEGSGVMLKAADAKSITIDLNKMTYTFADPAVGSPGTETQGFHFEKGNTVTVKNGTLNAKSGNENVKMLIQNYCDLTLDGVTVNGTNLEGAGTGRYVLSNNCGNVTIKNSTITAASGDFAFDSCKYASYDKPTVNVTGTSVINGKVEATGGDINFENGTTLNGMLRVGENKEKNAATDSVVTIKNGATVNCKESFIGVFGQNTLNIEGTVNGFVATNGNAYNAGSIINVEDGANLTNKDDVALYMPNGTLNISGGTITGATAVYFKSTNLSITGGTLIGNGAKADYNYNGNGANATGDALVIDSCNYPNGIVSVSVSGGNFTSANNKAVAAYTSQGAAPVTGFITGGVFSSDPTDYVDSMSYKVITLAENLFTVDTIANDSATKEKDVTVTVGGANANVNVSKYETENIAPEVRAAVSDVEVVSSDAKKAIGRAGDNVKAAITEGANVTVATIVKVDQANDGNKTAIANQAKAADSAAKVLKSIDVTVSETVTVQPAVDAAVHSTQLVTQTEYYQLIKIPFTTGEMDGKSSNNLIVYRQHGDTIAAMRKVSRTTGVAGPNYECFWIDGNSVVIRANKFSTYSLVLNATPVSVYTPYSYSAPVNTQTFSTDLDKITSVKVDGNTVNSKYYTVTGKNITLTEEFLNTLANGSHTFAAYGTINNAAKVATATFYITGNSANVTNPETGFGYIGIAAALAAIR